LRLKPGVGHFSTSQQCGIWRGPRVFSRDLLVPHQLKVAPRSRGSVIAITDQPACFRGNCMTISTFLSSLETHPRDSSASART
jgi:hypothetical protein